MEMIRIRGARTHNLQNIDLDLPRDRLIVLTGLSGSGKSSLAFDTIYAEGQRRYVESLSAYARQFLSMMEKPDVDSIEGLSPAISIEQKATSHNPRSTVGTVTEIHDYLRLLFARVGTPRCPDHDISLEAQTVTEMVDQVLEQPEGTKLMLLAPVVEGRKGEYRQLIDQLRAQGFIRARIDGRVVDLDDTPELDLKRKHDIEAVVDRFKVREDLHQRLAESFETALRLSDGTTRVAFMDEPERDELVFSERFACPQCGYSLAELEPRLFSFNNPAGACPECDGLGSRRFFDAERVVAHPELSLAGGAVRGWDRRNAYYYQMVKSLGEHYGFDPETPFEDLPRSVRDAILHGSDDVIAFRYLDPRGGETVRKHRFEGILPNLERRYRETESSMVRDELARYLSTQVCPTCGGARLNRSARHVFVAERSLPELARLSVERAHAFFSELDLPGKRGQIAAKILKEIVDRLEFLVNVGLEYLTLERSADTLAGGEAQRIRLASQIGSGLVGVMYVLDEPSIGLHQRDNKRLLNTLTYLRDLGNTVIVVEHDEAAIRSADYIVDLGPGAGVHGGHVVARGAPADIEAETTSLTGQYLAGIRRIELPAGRVPFDGDRALRLEGAVGNNLKDVTATISMGLLTCVTGVSGSGKSTLINDTLYKYVHRALTPLSSLTPAPMERLEGLDNVDRVIDIDQSPIGRTPRSNPATYTGLFTPIRELFAQTPEARARGYKPGRFSFNVKGGRCEACQGDGVIKVEMHFLPDIFVPCEVCHARRYNRETLDIEYKGKNIQQVLEMTVEEATEFFAPVPVIARKLSTLMDVGLGYVKLGQSATTLSGGEAQRVKLARELSKRETGNTLYILDEPTTGLHFHDIDQLLRVVRRLRDEGNGVIIIEHNLDVIKTADWIIDLGPEGGERGGEIVATGTPEDVARVEASYTGQFLRPIVLGSDAGKTASH